MMVEDVLGSEEIMQIITLDDGREIEVIDRKPSGDQEIILAHAAWSHEPYVTWRMYPDQNLTAGHYHRKIDAALADFTNRH